MIKRKDISVSFLIFTIVAFVVPSAGYGDIRKVGVIAPLSGPVSEHGAAILDGLRLGMQDGSCSSEVELKIEDDGFDPKRSVTAARKLIDRDHVELMMIAGSGPANAVAPYANQNRVPLLALAGDSKVSVGRDYVVRLRPTTKFEGEKISVLAKSIASRNIILVCNINDFTGSVCDEIERILGTSVSRREDIPPEDTDYRALVTKIKASNPELIIPILLPGKLGLFARQVREQGLLTPFVGGTFSQSSSDVKLSGGALVGAKYVMAGIDPEFIKRYMAFPTATSGSFPWAALFYDIGKMICQMKRSAGTSIEFIRSVRQFPSVIGLIDFKAEYGDQYFQYDYQDWEITKDGFSPLSAR